jgi:hypothetical protein
MAAPTSMETKISTSFGKAGIDQNSMSMEVDSTFWRMTMAASKKRRN